jgi:uridine phosphorylase
VKQLTEAELIVNNDGSIYHLGIQPEHVHDTVITVGDPERVAEVTKYFDRLDFSIQNREFKTCGGSLNGKDITVLSTGIGTDNIDIVLNEIALLRNYNLETRTQNTNLKPLHLIRLGTSGSVSNDHKLDSIAYSKSAISFDDLFQFYTHSFDEIIFDNRRFPVIGCSQELEIKFARYQPSLTLTTKGFYGPQFRNAQLVPKYSLAQISKLRYKDEPVGNIEMETAGIYGMSKLLGFDAISINAILAERLDGKFSANPQQTIERMITECLEIICS